MPHRSTVLVALVIAFSLVAVPSANAYIDPGSGSYIFQLIIAGALGAGVALKMFWRRILGFFTRRRVERPADEASDDQRRT